MSIVDLGEAEFLAGVQALLPRGAAWPREPDARLTGLLSGLAATQARQHARTGSLSERESDPSQADEMLADWEASYGLPDACTPADPLTASRRAALVARIAERRSPTPAAFVALAAALGIHAAITEHRAHTTEHDTEDPITDEDWGFVWDMLSPEVVRLERTTEDNTETPLEVWAVNPHECAVRRMAPAHTLVRFGTYKSRFDFSGGLPAGATLRRASPGTHADYRAQLTEDAADVARIDYDPALTYNLVPNPWGDGATIGSATPPVGWSNIAGGLTATVVGVGVYPDGAPYVEYDIAGTSNGNGQVLQCAFANPPLLPAVPGEVFSADIGLEVLSVSGCGLRGWLSSVGAAGLAIAASSHQSGVIEAGTPYARYQLANRTLSASTAVGVTVGLRIDGVVNGTAVAARVRIAFAVLTRGAVCLTDAVPLRVLAERVSGVPQYGLRGLLAERATGQGVRNPRMEGGVVGSPGTPPTGMLMSAAGGTISTEIVAFGAEDKAAFMDARVTGSAPGGTTWFLDLILPGVAQAVALGDVLSSWFNWRLVGGSWAGVSAGGMQLAHYNAGGGITSTIPLDAVPTDAPLRQQRLPVTWQVTDADAVRAGPRVRAVISPGATVDFTLRVGLGQIQSGGMGSDVFPPVGTVAPSARAEDILTLAVVDGAYEVTVIAGTVAATGTPYVGTGLAAYGQGLRFAWPAAALLAGERHIKSIQLRKVS